IVAAVEAAVPVLLVGGIVHLCAVKENADAMYLVYKENVLIGVLVLGGYHKIVLEQVALASVYGGNIKPVLIGELVKTVNKENLEKLLLLLN
ncbi:MAG TPA: hypothetical protein PLA57_01495, partial [Candidatus Paceibacterota bacterium]|nr:hypothetical protein [Candidatus Paceibacterota bacterium]